MIADVLRDHKKLTGMKEMNAKYRYVQLVRSLKTYGITFFECSEKLKGKKKPQLVLIGVTRDKILKVDPETQKTIKEWTLEQMRRWVRIQRFMSFSILTALSLSLMEPSPSILVIMKMITSPLSLMKEKPCLS